MNETFIKDMRVKAFAGEVGLFSFICLTERISIEVIALNENHEHETLTRKINAFELILRKDGEALDYSMCHRDSNLYARAWELLGANMTKGGQVK